MRLDLFLQVSRYKPIREPLKLATIEDQLAVDFSALSRLNICKRWIGVHAWVCGITDERIPLVSVLLSCTPSHPSDPGAYITCGDICRHAGRYQEAIDFYKKASGLDREKYARAVYDSRDRILALQAAQSLDLTRIRDGVYAGASFAYAGPLEVAVTVKNHRITNVKVTRHEEKQ